MLATLYEKGRSTITEHLKNIFDEGELDEVSVCRKFRRIASDGKGYITKFYNLEDKERLKNGTFLNEEYFDHLLEEIREIRASERRFYQKVTDIYATANGLFTNSTYYAKVF